MRSESEVHLARSLLDQGLTTVEVGRKMGIPRSTVRDWRNGRVPRRRPPCPLDNLTLLDVEAYAYLLGMYLGDGCLSAYPRGVFRLRITLDARYPQIVSECSAAMDAVTPGRVLAHRRPDERSCEVSNYWKHWPCLFPQHGPGPKHTRPIILHEWQQSIVTAHVERFLRGLIHSDGTRIIATERKGRYVRRASRYGFSNRSEDILQLFRAACELAGVHCTRASRKEIAIYSKAAVARLDEFVGPKE